MKKLQSGQTLIESVVALGIIMMILSTIAIIVINSLYNSQFIKQQNVANKYSEQGMEFVRSIQTSNLKYFSSLSVGPGPHDYCSDAALTALIDCSILPPPDNDFIPGTNRQFKRIITLERGNAGGYCKDYETIVTVTTSWTSSKCGTSPLCHNAKVKSCLVHDKKITP